MLLLTPQHHCYPFAHPHVPLASGLGNFVADSAPRPITPMAMTREKDEGGLALPGQNFPEALQCFGMAGWKSWVPVELIQHFGKRLLLLPACWVLVPQPWLTASSSSLLSILNF